MPSTGWNVFVASLVALVVYIAVQAEMVLLGIVAGTLTFLSGWLLGYAINHDLLDSMELSRILAAGGVTVFAIVWTLLYTQREYILGLIVVCLVWFAAWFTSSMGPIKGNTGAMETIDEPRPPAGTEPGEPLHLGGPEEQYNSDTEGDSGFLSGLLSFGAEDDVEYTTGPESESRSETAAQSADTQSSTTTSEGSIFGLGIFYEGEPEPSAGADDQPPARAEAEPATDPNQPSQEPDGDPIEVPVDPPEQQRKAAAADHTRPSVTETTPSNSGGAEPGGTEPAKQHQPRREPANSPGRDTQHPPSDPEASDNNHSASTGASGSTAAADSEANTATESAADDEGEEDPPEEHRVDVEDDDGGFVFG